MSTVDRLATFFEARPGQWIDGMALAQIAGSYAWRTRVSDLRKRGLTVENRQRKIGRLTISEYRFVPDQTPVLRAHDMNVWSLR